MQINHVTIFLIGCHPAAHTTIAIIITIIVIIIYPMKLVVLHRLVPRKQKKCRSWLMTQIIELLMNAHEHRSAVRHLLATRCPVTLNMCHLSFETASNTCKLASPPLYVLKTIYFKVAQYFILNKSPLRWSQRSRAGVLARGPGLLSHAGPFRGESELFERLCHRPTVSGLNLSWAFRP